MLGVTLNFGFDLLVFIALVELCACVSFPLSFFYLYVLSCCYSWRISWEFELEPDSRDYHDDLLTITNSKLAGAIWNFSYSLHAAP